MRSPIAADTVDPNLGITGPQRTAKRISTVGRVNRHPIRLQDLGSVTQKALLRVGRMDLQSSGHARNRDEIMGASKAADGTGKGMKLLGDLLPIIAFFIVFKAVGEPDGIRAATVAAIVVAAVQVGWTRLRDGHFRPSQLATLGLLGFLGGLTLVLRDPRYIQWKPTVVSWAMAIAFLGSGFIGEKSLVERMFGGSIQAPRAVWWRLSLAWAGFFLALGALNLYFAWYWSTEVWVNFKVFGTLGLSLAFTFIQALYLMRYDAGVNDVGKE
jgi:intracellular septation protein